MLSAIDRNHCPQSTGTPVRNRRNPQSNSLIVTARLVSDRIRTEIALEPCYPTPLSNSRTFGHRFRATEGEPWLLSTKAAGTADMFVGPGATRCGSRAASQHAGA